MNENTPNRMSRTRLCLGCWMLVTIDTSLSKYRRLLMFKSNNLPLMIKFSQLVDVKKSRIQYEKSVHIDDLIHFLYVSQHKFIAPEAQTIFKLRENEETLRFMPFPLMKKPKTSNSGPHTGRMK